MMSGMLTNITNDVTNDVKDGITNDATKDVINFTSPDWFTDPIVPSSDLNPHCVSDSSSDSLLKNTQTQLIILFSIPTIISLINLIAFVFVYDKEHRSTEVPAREQVPV